MPKLGSLQELTRVRESAKAALGTRARTGTVIRVGMGTCGIAAGARETWTALEEELARHGIEAYIGSVGCIGMCAREPLVEIQQAGRARILYGNVMANMVPRLVTEHLIKGEPVKEWVICRITREG
jgi:NADP-reducing hydrogenase subunit HndB